MIAAAYGALIGTALGLAYLVVSRWRLRRAVDTAVRAVMLLAPPDRRSPAVRPPTPGRCGMAPRPRTGWATTHRSAA